MVVETDYPFMAPPGKRRESNPIEDIPKIVERLSQLYECAPEHVFTVVTKTQEALLGIAELSALLQKEAATDGSTSDELSLKA